MSPSNPSDDRQRGYIIPIGGAEEKFHNPEILDRFVDVCGGRDARIAFDCLVESTTRLPPRLEYRKTRSHGREESWQNMNEGS